MFSSGEYIAVGFGLHSKYFTVVALVKLITQPIEVQTTCRDLKQQILIFPFIFIFEI